MPSYDDYTILDSISRETLTEEVTALLRQGWEPHGPLIARVVPDRQGELTWVYVQALVRPVKDEALAQLREAARAVVALGWFDCGSPTCEECSVRRAAHEALRVLLD